LIAAFGSGDNTYSNYQEAQRAFWRGTVLPLVNRMTKAFSGWLGPAYGSRIALKADLDQVDGLSAEREALWARLNAATFLSVNEKRAGVGYGPVDAAAGAGDLAIKFNPDQPRVPAGSEDGGQWTDGGGGGGGTGSAEGVRVSQARAGRTRVGARVGENWEATPAQEARLAIANGWAQETIRRVQERDPEWRPAPSFVESAEGAIARAEGEAREAEGRLRELLRDTIPSTNPEWGVNRLTKELYDRGYVFKEITRAPGSFYENPTTGEQVRIMERPSQVNRNDPA
jgi:Phage portal protein